MSTAENFFGPREQPNTIGDINAGNYFVAEQPDFGPGHITSPDQLTPGLVVEVLCDRPAGPDIERGTVVGVGLNFDTQNGFVEDPGFWVFDRGDGDVQSHALSDDGLLPYEGVGWQNKRYVRHAVIDPSFPEE